MKAIILAAGIGTRLEKYTKNLPKCMLRFNGKPLIEWQVKTLRACEIKEIVVVKGYMPDKLNIPNVKYYVNEDYASTNMVETLICAEEEMNEDILVCYSDILYEKKTIKKIIEVNVDIGVAVDENYWDYWSARLEKPEEDTESMVIREGRIVELGSKNPKKEYAKYRYVGIIKFSKAGAEILKKVYYKNKKKYFDKDKPWMASKSFKKAYMTCMLNAIIKSGYKVEPIIINKGWLEFDTNEDYEKITKWLKDGSLKRFYNVN